MTRKRDVSRGAAPLALRVGVVQHGTIIEERLFSRAQTVTAGSSPRNTIVITGAAAPARIALFSVGRRGHGLRLGAGVDGRINRGGQVQTLEQLRGEGSDRRGLLRLGPETRGKLFLGEVTLLFQLVQSPPAAPRAQLPPSVRRGLLVEMNWVMAASFIGVALLQAAFVVYLRSLDPPPPHELNPDDWSLGAAAPLLDNPHLRRPLDAHRTAAKGEQALQKVTPPEERADGGRAPRPPTAKASPCGQACKDRRLARIKRQIARVGVLALLTHKGQGPGPTVANLIGDGRPDERADTAFARVGGLTVASSSPSFALHGGPRKTRAPTDIDTLGRVNGPDGVETGDGGSRERMLRVLVTPDPRRIRCSLPVDEVARTIRRGMPAVRTCYQRALKRNHDLAGKLTLRLSVNTMGAVVEVDFDADTLGDPLVNSCITGYARRWRFPPSGEAVSDVSVPLVLRTSRP